MSNAKTTKPGTVEKVIQPVDPREPEKAQINIHGAEPLYQEIRIENTLTDEKGNEVKLKEGAEVEVHVEADKSATTPKKE
jgi:predicted DNA-binding antitoxin AbrB/MazE fold protein